ncbi:MAG: hypothetical protein IVW36_07205 [Dehalococcoidia bacterium]|nr:hypothetical protein [Dehalococcoidia bacterium]
MSGKFVRGGQRPPAKPATVLQARAFELHGTRYYAVIYRLDAEPGQVREARLSFDMIYDDPQPGDRVLVESVLGVVDRMARAEGR